MPAPNVFYPVPLAPLPFPRQRPGRRPYRVPMSSAPLLRLATVAIALALPAIGAAFADKTPTAREPGRAVAAAFPAPARGAAAAIVIAGRAEP